MVFEMNFRKNEHNIIGSVKYTYQQNKSDILYI
jgi:hypothetical protein